jgi:hypothetical protein
MLIKLLNTLSAIALALAFTTDGLGQQQTTSGPPPPDYVTTRDFKGKVFDLKHRRPQDIIRALSPLGSGFKGATMTYNDETQTISVRDFPENIAAVEEALKRLDAPGDRYKDPDIEIEMHVLIATNREGASSQTPAMLKDVINQLQSTLNYKSYHLLTSIVQRAKVRGQLQGGGVVDIRPPITGGEAYTDSYSFRVNRFSLSTEEKGATIIQMDNFSFSLREPAGNAEIGTSLGVHGSEKVVVGTASLKDKAMILVLSAKVIKY